MQGLVSRLIFVMALLGMLSSTAPRPEPHCAPQPAAGTSQHDHHGHSAKDTDGARECPHCPPVECGRHLQCSVSADPASGELAPLPVPDGNLEAQRLAAQVARSLSLKPPTPPPNASRHTNV